MKIRMAYISENDSESLVVLITKKSNGFWLARLITYWALIPNSNQIKPFRLSSEFYEILPRDITEVATLQPKPPRFRYRDPGEVMKDGTDYWGTCICPNPFTLNPNEAAWIGRGAKPTLQKK